MLAACPKAVGSRSLHENNKQVVVDQYIFMVENHTSLIKSPYGLLLQNFLRTNTRLNCRSSIVLLYCFAHPETKTDFEKNTCFCAFLATTSCAANES